MPAWDATLPGPASDPPMIPSLRSILLVALAITQQPESLQLTPSGPFLPSEQRLRVTIGKDADALLPDVLARWLSTRSAVDLNVIAEQLPAAWLPSNARFTRIPMEVAKRRWTEDCLRLLWLTTELRNDALVVTVTQGNRCGTVRIDDVFNRSPDGWQRRSGGGSGGGSGVGDCGCKAE